MSEPDPTETPTPVPTNRSRYQISLSTMLLIMVVFSVMSAGLYHAARVPAITNELNLMFGWETSEEESGRMVHLIFIMFTFSMPLVMAGTLATLTSVLSWWRRR